MGWSKTVICACPSGPVHRVRAQYQHVDGCRVLPGTGITGGYTGWVIRGAIPTHRSRAETVPPPTSDRRERALPCRGRVGRKQAVGRPLRVPVPSNPRNPPLRGPVAAQAPWGPGSLVPPRSSKGRDSSTFPIKLVKTAKCHRKVFKRPVIVPVFQNGPQKSPLGFPGFPFSSAFSHKELMGVI